MFISSYSSLRQLRLRLGMQHVFYNDTTYRSPFGAGSVGMYRPQSPNVLKARNTEQMQKSLGEPLQAYVIPRYGTAIYAALALIYRYDVFIRLRNYVYTACMCHVMRAPPEAFWPSLLGVPARSLQGRTASDKSWAWRPLNEVNHAKVHAQSWCLPHIHRSNVLRLVRSALPVWHIHIHPMIASISVDKCSTTHSSCCLVLEDAYIPHYYSGQ